MKVWAWPCVVLLMSACGRVGFDPHGGGDDQGSVELDDGGFGSALDDGGVTVDDAGMQVLPCADRNLGSALGPNVASGTTSGEGNNYSSCSGDGNDITFGWFAPATASYRIDLCASQMSLDTVLYVRNGSCTGTSLACNDDGCGLGGLQSRVTVSLQAGQAIVIIVDELFPTGGGTYQLAITQL
jgi:hypothetical protein